MPKLSDIPRSERVAILVSLGVGLLLLAIKFAAYYLTGSTAIFADALEGIVNVAASAFAAYALMLAHQPADAEHPYGHGKIEFLSAGFEGGMILLAAIVAIGKAIDTLLRRLPLRQEALGVGVVLMVIALVMNAAVGLALIRIGQKKSSLTLEADGKHLMTDALTSTVALLALLIVRVSGWSYADPIAAIGVSLYIGLTGIGLLRRSAAGLMDQQDAADTAMLRGILDSHLGPAGVEPRICSYHKLRHRHSGRYHWVDFHMVVPAKWDIEHGHRAASAIEYEIEQALGEGNATAHVEPCVEPECASCQTQRDGSLGREFV
jgi:cation diffusion facilitator family transporter